VRERLQGVLKTYVKARKNEIKSRAKDSRAATSATASYGYLEAPTRVKLRALLGLLVDEKAVLPADKKLGTSMSGAFLIWTPFLLALCRSSPSCLRSLLDAMMGVGSASSRVMVHLEQDPAREAFHDWSVHILSSAEWEDARRQTADPTQSGHGAERRLLDYVLGHTFTIPTFWTLKLAESLLKDEDLSGRVSWLKILEAAKSEDIEMDDQQGTVAPISAEDMDVDITDVALPVLTSTTNDAVAKLRGPQKKVGLWKTQPIGMIPQGWEVDE
jgi:ribosomal biogenesis protein LAS1